MWTTLQATHFSVPSPPPPPIGIITSCMGGPKYPTKKAKKRNWHCLGGTEKSQKKNIPLVLKVLTELLYTKKKSISRPGKWEQHHLLSFFWPPAMPIAHPQSYVMDPLCSTGGTTRQFRSSSPPPIQDRFLGGVFFCWLGLSAPSSRQQPTT